MNTIKFKASTSEMRNYCIRNNFYTAGDCREYENMFSMLTQINHLKTLEDLYINCQAVANDILDHTPAENWFYEEREDCVADMIFDMLNSDIITFLVSM